MQIAAGSAHNCAILVGGDLVCWGRGDFGRLGYGNEDDIGDDETPASLGESVDVGGLVVQVTAGSAHTCALTDEDEVRCWGYAGEGQTGQGNTVNIGDDEVPGSVGAVSVGLATAMELSAGTTHTCVLFDDFTVRCWGLGSTGQLGLASVANVGDDETPGSVPTVQY